MNQACRLIAACSLLVCILAGVQAAKADQVFSVGAPLDKMNHTVVIFEAQDETIMTVTVSTGTGKDMEVPRNKDGSFTLGINIQPGDGTAQTDLVYNNFFTNELGEDSLRLEAKKGGGVNLTKFFSEGGDTDNFTGREQESISVSDGLKPEHITTFIISSPPEPTPEPASLILVGCGLFGLCGFRQRRSRGKS
jgi:hypothetical protein